MEPSQEDFSDSLDEKAYSPQHQVAYQYVEPPNTQPPQLAYGYVESSGDESGFHLTYIETLKGTGAPQDSSTRPMVPHIHRHRDWNAEWQAAFDTIEPSTFFMKKRVRNLQSLERQFSRFCSNVAAVIVCELENAVPNESKLVKPTDKFGGLAGGVKYIYGTVLFKLAQDWLQIYGSEELAQKAADLEIKGFNAFVKYGSPLLHVSLTCNVRIGGHCIVATALAPLGNSLVYGTADACKTIVNSSEEMDRLMRDFAHCLNLLPHRVVAFDGTEVYLAIGADVEGHQSMRDGRLYVVDGARVFPPTLPRDSSVYRTAKVDFLCRHFRDTFLKDNCGGHPISSDVCSRFTPEDEHNEQLDRLYEAEELLHDVAIPKLVARLLSIEWKNDVLMDFSELFHSFGINMRYLGEVWLLISEPVASEAILIEIICRCMKSLFREAMRLHPRSTSFQTFNFLKVIYEGSDESNELWKEDIVNLIFEKFGLEAAKSFDEDYLSQVYQYCVTFGSKCLEDSTAIDPKEDFGFRLCQRLLQSLQISSSLLEEDNGICNIITAALLSTWKLNSVSCNPRVKSVTAPQLLSPFEAVEFFWGEYTLRTDVIPKPNEKTVVPLIYFIRSCSEFALDMDELNEKITHIEEALIQIEANISDSHPVLFHLARVELAFLFLHLNRFKEAFEYLNSSLGQGCDKIDLYCCEGLAKYHGLFADFDKEEEFVIRAYEVRKILEPFRADSMNTTEMLWMAHILGKRGSYYKSIELIEECIKMDESALGQSHPKIGLELCILATHYMKVGRNELIQCTERAFDIAYETMGRETANYALVLSSVGMGLFYKGSFDKAEEVFQNSLDILEKIFGFDSKLLPVAVARMNLALILSKTSQDSQRIQELTMITMDILIDVFGEDSHFLGPFYLFTSVLNDALDEEQRLDYFERSEKLLRKKHGDIHVNLVPCYVNREIFQRQLGIFQRNSSDISKW